MVSVHLLILDGTDASTAAVDWQA